MFRQLVAAVHSTDWVQLNYTLYGDIHGPTESQRKGSALIPLAGQLPPGFQVSTPTLVEDQSHLVPPPDLLISWEIVYNHCSGGWFLNLLASFLLAFRSPLPHL